jgi:hypothetical protein
MFNFPFYNKHTNYLILDKNLRDHIKKSNTDSFNKFAEKQQYQQQYKNIKTILSNSLLSSSLINYRNYSDTFINNQICHCDLENEDYLCNFCDLDDDNEIEFNNKNSKPNTANTEKITIAKKMFFLIGGTTAFIGIGTWVAVLYYKYF